jgi:hypothetical protein
MNIEISKPFADAIKAYAVGDVNETAEELIADGLRLAMLNGDPPIHPHFIEPLTPEGVAVEFRRYLEAVRGRIGIDANAKYYFAQLPAGGAWEAAGLAGAWELLPVEAEPTADGHRDREAE